MVVRWEVRALEIVQWLWNEDDEDVSYAGNHDGSEHSSHLTFYKLLLQSIFV